MADFSDSIPLPENRVDLENMIEAAISRLDEMDGDPDLEPMLGANDSGWHCGSHWPAEWADHSPNSAALDECEDVSEDEGAACEDEGAVEEDCDSDIEDEGPGWVWGLNMCHLQQPGWARDLMARQEAERQATAKACQAALDGLRAVERGTGSPKTVRS